ncbi:MAG: hypothetical protein EOO61_20565 [Hymenobacter sp.]|nr:MAG: hypothetical protein EOO61_20565 [Hymenobacter sp.]
MAHIVSEYGLSEAMFYAWESNYAETNMAELTRLKHSATENRQFKQIFVDLSLEKQAIKEILRKVASPAARRQTAQGSVSKDWSQQRAWVLGGLLRSSYQPVVRRHNDEPTQQALQTLTGQHPGWRFL